MPFTYFVRLSSTLHVLLSCLLYSEPFCFFLWKSLNPFLKNSWWNWLVYNVVLLVTQKKKRFECVFRMCFSNAMQLLLYLDVLRTSHLNASDMDRPEDVPWTSIMDGDDGTYLVRPQDVLGTTCAHWGSKTMFCFTEYNKYTKNIFIMIHYMLLWRN